MKSSRFQKAANAVASFVAFFFCLSLQAQQHTLRVKHIPDVVHNGQASAVGQLETDNQLHLVISLPLRNEDALNTLLQQIYDPQSPNFHHYLTSQQFTDSFEPAQQDYDTVIAWAKAKGLQVTATTANRRLIEVDAPVGTINRAFNVLLTTFQDRRSARTFHAPDREPTVDLAVPLLSISGLDDASPMHSHYGKSTAAVQAPKTVTENLNLTANISGSGPGNTYVPSDMRAAYYGSGPLTGAGQTVAIFSYNDYLPADLNIFYTHTGMTASVPVTNVYVNGYNTPCFGFNANGTINYGICDDGEQILDIVNVIGMAPGLTKVLFYEGNSATAILNQMAVDNKASVISSSWGGGDFGAASVPSFLRFQAQGQTYLNATGDWGQFNTSTYDPPSVDPNITQVGGTNLITMGAGGPWSSETGWAYSGGGFMAGTAIPTWQLLTGVINSSNMGSLIFRNAPDVAAEANFDNTTVINGAFLSGYGGTSFAAPRWAGFIALANQQAALNGTAPVGFINPTIYNIGIGSNYAADFHDIISGLNRPAAGAGSGFNAVAGYDLVTGWGSPNGAALIANLLGSASPDYSLAASPNPVTIPQGSNGTTTVTVTDIAGFTGSVALSASLPTGVTASFSPASTTGTSVLTLTVASTAPTGLKAITITGTSGSLTHTANLALNLTSGADYSLSAAPTSVSVVQGMAGTSTVTVTPINSFSGSVALSASGLPAGVTASFSPASATTSSFLTLTASSIATLGPATVTITGTSGSLIHTTTVTLTVTPAPDYSLSASPNSVSVVQGNAGTSMVTVTGLNGFAGPVALSASGLPAGVTASFSPASATTTSILTLTASSTATLGLATVTITGTSGSLSHTTTVALTITPAPDYSLSASPNTLSVAQGTTGTSTITVTGLNSFAGSVALTATGLPTGVTASFSPASATTTSTLTLTALSTATLGLATVTITGTSGSLTHITTVALTIKPAPDYSLSASPNTLSVVQGTTGTSTVTVTGINSFDGSVALAATGLPAGVTASFSPASATTTSTLTLTASLTATVGPATITITGTSGSLTHTTTVTLTVVAAPDYSLSASPNALSVVQGTAGTSTITVTGLNSFNGSVALSASGLPAGVTASFSPSSTTGTSILTLTGSTTATVGPATITITGTSGSLTHTTAIALTITPAPDYSLSGSPVSVIQGNSGTSTISVIDLNGFTGAVNLAASGLPAGVTASFSPASTTGTSTLTLTASATATGGPATITITGISGSLTHTTTVALTVLAPDYSLSAPASLTIARGTSGTGAIAVTDLNTFTGAVNLAVSGLPSGVNATFSPATTTTSSNLTLTGSSWAAMGSTTLTITGTSGALVHTATLALTVSPPPDFSLALAPTSFSLPQGSSQSGTLTITGTNGFNSPVSFTITGLRPGVTASFSPPSTTGTTTLTLTAASTASVGSGTMVIMGTAGSVSHEIYVMAAVTATPDYTLSASPSNVSVAQGASGTSAISISPISGFNGAVALTASGLPSGVTASFSPASTTIASTLILTASSTAALGPATVTITGVSGSQVRTTTVNLTITSAGDYSLSATPASVVQGASGTSTVAVTDIGGFTGAANLSASGLPAGVTASFSPASTTSTSVLTLTAASTAAVGPATITVTGISGNLIHTTTFTLTVTPAPDYSLSASPSSVSVVQGNAGTSTITVNGINNFAGSVALSASGMPAGVTASFSPNSTTGTSILTLSASGTTTVGPATITITGTSGTLSHTTTLTLTVVAAPDYSLSATPASVVQGNSGTSTITVNGINNFAGSVALSASGMPVGVTASFSPNSTTGTSILTLTASSTATVGPASITITGISGSLTHTTTLTLTVVSAPDYSMSASPNNISVVQGNAGTSTISIAGVNNFAGSVALAASGLPAGVTASFSPASTPDNSTLTLTASNAATVGPATVIITGTSGSLTHTTVVTLTVVAAPDYSLSASPNSVSAVQGTSGTSTITVNGINNFTGSVALSASGLPIGVTAAFSPNSTTGSSILTLTAPSTATVGPATITITGISGSLTHTTTVTLTVIAAPDYSLSAAPSSVTLVQGNAGTSTITVNGINSFAGSVSLSAGGLPAGVTASFSPASTTSTSILTLTASGTATVGQATVTITGTSGSLTHSTTVTLNITPAPDYALSATSASVVQGTSGSSTVTVTDLNNFNGAVGLVASGLPAGVTASFSPATTTSTSILTLTASSTATLGVTTVTITGTSGSLTHTTTLTLTIMPAPDYALSATSVSIGQGTSGVSTVTVMDLNNFNGSVGLTVSGLPAGVNAFFSPNSTTGTSILTLNASSSANVGSSTVTVTGNSGGLIHSTTLTLTILTPDYSLSATPGSVSIARGTSGTSTITVNDLNGFSGAVKLAASGLPSGVTASFSPATTTGSSTLTLTGSSWAAIGSWTVTITGTSGNLVRTTTVAFTVAPPPDFSFALSPNSFSIAQGSSQGNTITVTGINGFNSLVNLTVTGLPAGVTASVSPASTGSTSTLTLTAAGTAPMNSQTIVITGTSGALTHQLYIALSVTPAQ